MLSIIAELYNPKQIDSQRRVDLIQILTLLTILWLYSYIVVDRIAVLLGNRAHTDSFSDLSVIEIVSALLFAPVIEEVVGRTCLSGKPSHAWGLPLMLLFCTITFKSLGVGFLLVSFMAILVLSILMIRKRVLAFIFRIHYNKTFYFVSIVFAISHFFVIDEGVNLYSKIVLVLVAYLPLSLIFGYIRVKYGLVYSIFAHMLNNVAVLSINLILYS